MIAADDVVPPGKRHNLCLVINLFAPLADHEGYEWSPIVEHQLAYNLVAALAHTKDVQQVARFEFGQRLGTQECRKPIERQQPCRRPTGRSETKTAVHRSRRFDQGAAWLLEES
jgi:hypothetical protein